MRRMLRVLALAVLGGAAAFGAAAQTGSDLAAKRTALEKLCALEVLSADECARRRAELGGGEPAAPASAEPRVFNDPDGRYSAIVPDGWNSASNNGVATFSSGEAWATIMPSPANRPDEAVNALVNQLRAGYAKLDQSQSGRPKIGGHEAAFVTFSGVNPKNESVAVTVAGLLGPSGHVLVYMSSAPLARIDDYSKTFYAIAEGVRFAGEGR